MHRAKELLSVEALLADSSWLRGLARGIVGESGAEDLVQETWVRVLCRPPSFLGNLRPWLRTVARNLSLRERDREKRRARVEARRARAEGEPSTADLVARASLRRSVVDSVLQLEEPYRSTILLRYFEEMPPREIARRQAVPVATVRTRLRRGLELLRTRLDDERGGRRAWLALLLPARGLVGAGWLTGAIIMGTKVKVACIAAAVILCAIGAWEWWRVNVPDAPATASVPGPLAEMTGAPQSAPAGTPAPAPRSDTRNIVAERYRDAPAAEFAITGVAVDDRTGQPVEGIRARLVSWARDPDAPESAPTERPTDKDGRFRVPIAEPERVRGITLLSPEFAPLVADHLENEVRLAAKKGNLLDLGTLRLLRGAPVTGRVVSAETGAPIAGAALYLSARGYPVSLPLLYDARPVGHSASDGTFVLTERAPPHGELGEEILAAMIEDGVGWAFLSVMKDREAIDGVEVKIARGAALKVTVVDESDKPVEGAFVSAAPRFAPLGPPAYFGPNYADGWLPADRRDHFRQKTGADGVVGLRGLPIGREDERFRQYPSSMTGYDVTVHHPDFVYGAPHSVSVDPANETSARVKLARRKLCAVGGKVTTESGQPIAGAKVQDRSDGTVVATDQDGAYRFEKRDTAWGRVSFEVRAAGFAMTYRTVVLPSRADEVVADIVLLKSMPIEGQVVDQDGRLVPRAYVDILGGGSGEERRQYRPDGGGDLDAEGRFVFSDATAGTWELRAHGEPLEDWGANRQMNVQGGDRNVKVVLHRRPPARARLEVEVVDAQTGAPVDPASAFLSSGRAFVGDSIPTTKTQVAVGRVTAEKIWPGTWRIDVRLTDGSRTAREFVVKPEDTMVRLRLEIGRPGVVTVRIDLSGISEAARPSSIAIFTTPYDAVQWVARPGEPAPRATRGFGEAEAAKDWTVRFEDVTPNVPIRFFTHSDGGVFGQCQVQVGFGEAKEVVLRLTRSAGVTFVRPAQAPPAGVVISLRRPDETWEEACSDVWEDGKDWKWTRKILPGRIAWRAERYPLESSPEDRRPTGVLEGERDVAPGESWEIPLAFPR